MGGGLLVTPRGLRTMRLRERGNRAVAERARHNPRVIFAARAFFVRERSKDGPRGSLALTLIGP